MFVLFVEFVPVVFTQIRARSIQAISASIDDKPVIDKILLAKKYHIKEWLFEGYTSLVLQEQPSFNQLLLTLDPLTVARLFYVREIILRSRLSKPPLNGKRKRSAATSATTPPVAVGLQVDVDVACVDCGRRQLKSFPLDATDAMNHVTQEFASEIITW